MFLIISECCDIRTNNFFKFNTFFTDQMCVAGGRVGIILSSVELYNPVVNTWTNIALMKTKRWGHALVSYNGWYNKY